MHDERSLAGLNFVFFGGTAGIGLAAAKQVAERGGHLLLVGRNQDLGQSAVQTLKAAGAASADFLSGDLSTIQGVAKVAASVKNWRPHLHGAMHTAMSAFHGKQLTVDSLEFSFALQYFSRAALNRLLLENLAASGDGRVVHIAGNVPTFFMPDLEDLQFERRKWGYFKAILGTHLLGFLHLQEASRRWQSLPVSLTACCVNSTKTKVMADVNTPLLMRLMGRFGTSPEQSAKNAVRVLTQKSSATLAGSILRNPNKFTPEAINLDTGKAQQLWDITSDLASKQGLRLP